MRLLGVLLLGGGGGEGDAGKGEVQTHRITKMVDSLNGDFEEMRWYIQSLFKMVFDATFDVTFDLLSKWLFE